MSDKMMFCWRNVFSGVVNTAFHMFSREKLWDKRVFFQKNMFDFLFWFWMKKFRICGKSFQQGCQKQIPRDQRNFLVKIYLEEDTTLCLLMVFLRKIWFAKNSMFVSKAFFVQWNILRVKFPEETKLFELLGTERECFGFLAKEVWQSCQNYFPCDQSNFWIKFNFFSKKIALLILLPTFSEKFQYSLKTDPPALSSPHTSRPQ